tara:strand:+ start:86 stop:778 length:693 start_codon:yes stop_codon:yes gene_type:complete
MPVGAMKRVIIIVGISMFSASIDNTFILIEPIEENSAVVMYYQFINSRDTVKGVSMDIPNNGSGVSIIDYGGIDPKDDISSNMLFDIVSSNAFIRFAVPSEIGKNEYERQFKYNFSINKDIGNLAAAIAMPANGDSFKTNLENMEDSMPPESGINNTMFYSRKDNWNEDMFFPIEYSYENPYLRHKFTISNVEHSIKSATNKYIIAVILLSLVAYLISSYSVSRKKIVTK